MKRRWYLLPVTALAFGLAVSVLVRAFPSEVTPDKSRGPLPEVVEKAGPLAAGAYSFLLSRDLAEEPLDALVVDFVGRRFGIESLRRFSPGAVDKLVKSEGPDRLYMRLVMPASDLPDQVRTARLPSLEDQGPIVYYPLLALHCDRFPLEPSFLDGLWTESSAGGYRTTHSALALLWGYEQGCIDRASTKELFDAHLRALSETISNQEFPGDLYVEALALYEFMTEKPVPDSLIEKVAGVQLRDGSLPYARNDLSGSIHTTALALWVALEHINPENSPDGWIIQPGPPARTPLKGYR